MRSIKYATVKKVCVCACILVSFFFRLASSSDVSESKTLVIKDRLPVLIGLEESTAVGDLRVNDLILARVRRPIHVGKTTAVDAGQPVILTVKYVRRRGILGSPAKVILEASHIELRDHGRIHLSGEWAFEGEDLSIEAISGGSVICCLGFFLPGGEVVLGKGSGFTAFVAGDQTIILQNSEN